MVLVQQEPGLGRGGLFSCRGYTQLAWPCTSGMHWRVLQGLEMSQHGAAAELAVLWHPSVAQLWSTVGTVGLCSEHFLPSRIRLQEVLYAFTALLGCAPLPLEGLLQPQRNVSQAPCPLT